ncbi:exported hypothetical protein [[Clostridium] ultunense Esp]|uniref:hypothetical protein n=1 Tax=Thermicanus aegyptius TaxID=94009 RepID=UPI0002B70AF4|nr:hypothetical protein [Thermicanus aegyptius]CCQ98182.1 exported hypothetical protein [[Clostridium] ultunense Esp]
MLLKAAFVLLLVIGILLLIRVIKGASKKESAQKRSGNALESLALLIYDSILLYFAVLVVGVLLGVVSSYLFE